MITITRLLLLSLPLLIEASELTELDGESSENGLRRSVTIRRRRPLSVLTGNEDTEEASFLFSLSGSKRPQTEHEIPLAVKKSNEAAGSFNYDDSEVSSLSSSSSRSDSFFDESLAMPDLPATSSFPSCLKGTTSRPPCAVSFDSDAMDATTFDLFGTEAENYFFDTLYAHKYNRAFAMRQQGLTLSNSSIVFRKVKGILISRHPSEKFINFLFKNFPHVFTQSYLPEFGSLFEGISQHNASLILNGFSPLRSAHFAIFQEAVHIPEFKLGDTFDYSPLKLEQTLKMIHCAEGAHREDIVAEIIAKTRSPVSQNSSLLIDAITEMKLERIKLILRRSDAINIIIHKLESGEYEGASAVDSAVRMHDQGLDNSYEVMKVLLKILPRIRSISNLRIAKSLLNEFVDNCVEADDNEEIMETLVLGLESILTRGRGSESGSEFIVLVRDRLAHIRGAGAIVIDETTVVDDATVIYDATVIDEESGTNRIEAVESETDMEEDVRR